MRFRRDARLNIRKEHCVRSISKLLLANIAFFFIIAAPVTSFAATTKQIDADVDASLEKFKEIR